MKYSAGIFIHERKILLVRSRQTFSGPGGKSEEGESALETFLREAQEEVAVNLRIDNVEGSVFFTKKQRTTRAKRC